MGRVLITGGTGTLGRTLVKALCEDNEVTVYSRDEYKQAIMLWEGYDCHFVTGDVRDLPRLTESMHGHDLVIHAAAMKQVSSGHRSANELVQTNVHGTQNALHAALETGVAQFAYVSSDKAVNPLNMYGVTKKLGEQMVYNAGCDQLQTLVARWGNVVRSRGSVLERWERTKRINIGGQSWTRYWLTRDEAADFLLTSLRDMPKDVRQQLSYPKMKATNMSILATAAMDVFRIPGFDIAYQPLADEKQHEQIADDESSDTAEQIDVRSMTRIIADDVKQWPL
jgi:UDP-N-acetylglucosamine 4,6-dehydratase